MVWWAFSGKEANGPHLLENETVTGVSYKIMLPYFELRRLHGDPENMTFEQDVAFPHYAVIMHQYLYQIIPNRWMGKAERLYGLVAHHI